MMMIFPPRQFKRKITAPAAANFLIELSMQLLVSIPQQQNEWIVCIEIFPQCYCRKLIHFKNYINLYKDDIVRDG